MPGIKRHKDAPDGYKTMRIPGDLHAEMTEHVNGVFRRTGSRLYLTELLQDMWKNYQRIVGDPNGQPPVVPRSDVEYHFLTQGLDALRQHPLEVQRELVRVTVRLLSPVPVPEPPTKSPAKKR